jgi:hypothetical protein
MGGSIEEAADILGDSEIIIRQHYAKWSSRRQARISDLLGRMWYANGTHPNANPEATQNEAENLVDLVRFELTTSSMPWKRAPNCATGPMFCLLQQDIIRWRRIPHRAGGYHFQVH